MKTLSVIIPVYNEAATIRDVIERVKAAALPGISTEIIVVDDGSYDGTGTLLEGIDGIRLLRHPKNLGKGRAVRTGLSSATGDVAVIQDADMEYDPRDYPRLLEPILSGQADVVYGSRFLTIHPHRVLFFHHYLANRFLTFFSNLFTNLNLTDMETGYKMFTRKVYQSILPKLVSSRFGIEPELTARVARSGARVYEVGISYYGRDYRAGKKINWRDGIAAFWHIIRFNLF